MDDAAIAATAGGARRARAREFDSPAVELRVWLRLFTCAGMIERQVRRRLRDRFATTLPRFDVMAQLDRADDALTMGELSHRLLVSNGNLTGLVDRLAADGLVERRADAADRRVQRVRLTAAGRRAFRAIAPAHAGWIEDALDGLGPRDKRRLLALLDGLRATLLDHEAGR